MRARSLLVFAMIALAAPAAADVSEEDLKANKLRKEAYKSYLKGLAEKHPAKAFTHFFAARDSWKPEGYLTIYQYKKENMGMDRRYRIDREERYDYAPSERILERLKFVINQEAKAASAFTPPRQPDQVIRTFNLSEVLILQLGVKGFLPTRVAALKAYRKQRIDSLLPKSAPVAPPRKDPPRKEPPPEEPKVKAPTQAEIQAGMKRFRRLETLNLRLQGELREGKLAAAAATVKETEELLSATAKLTLRLSNTALFAPLRDGIETGRARLEADRAGLEALEALPQARRSSAADAETRARFLQGMKAARSVGADIWSRAEQQQMAVALVSKTQEKESEASAQLRPWLAVFDEPLARAILEVELGDLAAKLERPRPALTSLEGLDLVVARRLALAMAIRGYTIAEEAKELRERPALAVVRHELYRELLGVFLTLRPLVSTAPAGVYQERLAAAVKAVETELILAPYGVLRDVNQPGDEPVVRVAGFFDLLPELEKSLSSDALAKAYVAIGIGARLVLDDDACEWIIREAVGLNPDAMKSVPAGLSSVTVKKLRRKYEAKKKAG